jgi:hypothetical protein
MNLKYISSIFSMLLVVICLQISAAGQMAEDKKLAAVTPRGLALDGT